MQTDRTVSLACVLATVLWTLTLLLIVAGSIAAITSDGFSGLSMSLVAYGLACSAGAATVTIRNGQKHQDRLLSAAFDLGKDAERLRRVR